MTEKYHKWPDRETKISYSKQYYARKRAEIFATQSCIGCGSKENLGIVSMKGDGIVRCADCKRKLRIPDPENVHNATRYRTGCRCETCCAAKRAEDKRYLARKKLKRDQSVKTSKRIIAA